MLIGDSNTNEVVAFFEQMQVQGHKPSHLTWRLMFAACIPDANLELGRQLHAQFLNSGLEPDSNTEISIVHMYAHCGSLHDAERIWTTKLAQSRNIVAWNVIIGAFGMHGQPCKAIELFELAIRRGLKPTEITFAVLLHACRYKTV